MEFILFFYFLTHGPEYKIQYTQKIEQAKQVDIRVQRLDLFFQRFDSTFGKYSSVFVDVADEKGFDYRLLPVIACVESSCGKNYKKNAFGWGSDKIDFGPDDVDIIEIANKIDSLSYYQKYKRSGQLYDFALAYNGDYAKDYYEKLKWFWEKI